MTEPEVRESERRAAALGPLWEWGTIRRVLLAVEALAVILALAPGIEGSRWRYFLLASLTIQWVVLLTLGLLYLLRNELGKFRPVQVAYATLLMLVMSTLFVVGTVAALNNEAWDLIQSDPTQTLLRVVLISLTAGTVSLLVFRNYWTARQLALETKQAQLEALRARVQPHFLFNTLNTAVALVRAQPDKAERVLMDLADLFRAALASPRDIPLSEELATTRRYLDIEALRLGSRMRLTWNVPDALPAGVMIPSLSIQPLAENAVRHGIEPSPSGGEILIDVTIGATAVTVVVANDVPSDVQVHVGHHVGLTSARERIAALGPDEGRFSAQLEDGRHVVTVQLALPN